MSQPSFSSDWLKRFSDPYAVLGVSVAADDRRILKRYRDLAKALHPDSYSSEETVSKELATQLFARLVNPAYQKVKQERDRAETLAMLRFQVRRLNRQGSIATESEVAQKLLQMTMKEAEVFYEQALVTLVEHQYQPLQRFELVTQQVMELNRVYLHLKMGDLVIREKRTGLVASAEAKPVQFTPTGKVAKDAPVEDYARRHYERAQEYLKKGGWQQAVQELRDAIKLEANKSEYHSAIGLAYLKQNLTGMATVHFRQALKLNPNDPLALRYAAQLNLAPAQQNGAKPAPQSTKQGGILGFFGFKKP